MEQKIVAYIDAANLHRGSRDLGFDIDYKKFYGWLCQKYNLSKIYLFLGFLPWHQKEYDHFEECGYYLIFKETITSKRGETKGNCDAELILKSASDYYEKNFDSCIIISGDGDFKCLIDFLNEKNCIKAVLCPVKSKSSYLIRKVKIPVIFLDDHYHKFLKVLETEKAPDADVSA